MTEPETEQEMLEGFPREGDEVILAGIELHAHIEQENGDQKIIFTYRPTVTDRELPEIMTEFNSLIEMTCRKTVAVFPQVGFGRFYTVLKKSGESDRCWYRLRISLWDDERDVTHEKISDWIDPELLLADPHVAHRGKKAMAMMRRLMKEFLREFMKAEKEGKA